MDVWTTEISDTVTDLIPNTLYEVAIKCRRLGKGGEGDVSPGLFVKTECGGESFFSLTHIQAFLGNIIKYDMYIIKFNSCRMA